MLVVCVPNQKLCVNFGICIGGRKSAKLNLQRKLKRILELSAV
jgi:hypothetical protein